MLLTILIHGSYYLNKVTMVTAVHSDEKSKLLIDFMNQIRMLTFLSLESKDQGDNNTIAHQVRGDVFDVHP